LFKLNLKKGRILVFCQEYFNYDVINLSINLTLLNLKEESESNGTGV